MPDGRRIDLEFGVKGGGQIQSGSGQVIAGEITAITNAINASNAVKLNFKVDAKAMTQIKKDLQKLSNEMAKITAKPVTLSGGGSGGAVSAQTSLVNKLKEAYANLNNYINASDANLGTKNMDAAKSSTKDYLASVEKLRAAMLPLMSVGANGILPIDSADPAKLKTISVLLDDMLSKRRIALGYSREEIVNTNAAESATKKANAAEAERLRLVKQVEAASANLGNFGNAADKNLGTGLFANDTAKLAAYNAQLERVKAALSAVALKDESTGLFRVPENADIAKLKSASDEISKLNAIRAQYASGAKVGSTQDSEALGYRKVADSAYTYYLQVQDIIKAYPQLDAEMRSLMTRLQTPGSFSNIKDTQDAFLSLKIRIREAGIETDTFGAKLIGAFKSKIKYMGFGVAAMYLRNVLGKMVANVKEIDSELTQMQIITGKSEASVRSFGNAASRVSQQIGASTTSVINAATVFARLGYSMQDSLDLSKFTTMYSKIGAVDMQDAEDNITAIVKAYDIGTKDLESVMDKIVMTGKQNCRAA